MLGPLFFTTYSLGPVTADNALSAAGSAILAIAVLRRAAVVQIQGPVIYPLGIVVLLLLSIAPHGVDVVFNVARFAGLALLVLAIQIADPGNRRQISMILNIVVIASAVIILVQPLTNWPAPWGNVEGEGVRYGGLYGHPNFAAYTLAIFSLYQVVRRGSLQKRVTLIIVPLMAMMLSGSRTAIIVFGAVMIFALLIKPKRVWPFALGAALVGIVAGSTFISRFADFFQTGGFEGGANAGGWRIIQWQYALNLAPSPNVWGVGWGNAERLLPLGLGVHNGYLQFYVETGIVGTFIFALVLIITVLNVGRSLPSGLLCCFAVATTMFDPVLMYPSSLAVFLVILSLDYYSSSSEVGSTVNGGLPHITKIKTGSGGL